MSFLLLQCPNANISFDKLGNETQTLFRVHLSSLSRDTFILLLINHLLLISLFATHLQDFQTKNKKIKIVN